MHVCFADYDREIALVAEHADKAKGTRHIIGVGRLSRIRGRSEAEFALIVADRWQNRGLGTKLMSLLIETARQEKLTRLMGYVLFENIEMQRLCEAADSVPSKIPRRMWCGWRWSCNFVTPLPPIHHWAPAAAFRRWGWRGVLFAVGA